jgi:fructuronate reductase
MNLSLATLDRVPRNIARPSFDPRRLKTGILHLGVGNFHRAHQAIYTEDAIAKRGGDWGIVGVSLRRPDMPALLTPQDNLYTVETLGVERHLRVMGVIGRTLTAPESRAELFGHLSAPHLRIVSLTITEKGYCLDGSGALAEDHPDIVHDLKNADEPRSAIAWIVRGLARRAQANAAGVTIISCDNLSENGAKLARAVLRFARMAEPSAVSWIEDSVSFPQTMVDCIVPATDAATISRVETDLALHDSAPVAREEFAQWVIENKFSGPRPAWDEVGAEIVSDVASFERLKLHVLNASHSTLAYRGIPRGHRYVRQAIADPELARFVEAMVLEEIAPALAPLDVTSYWARVRARFANPRIDHRLAQIAEDGSAKLAQRIFPLLVANIRAGRPASRLAQVVRAWLAFAKQGPVKDPERARLAAWAQSGARTESALDDAHLFPEPFRTDPSVRALILKAPA